jgi:hypothetical protein
MSRVSAANEGYSCYCPENDKTDKIIYHGCVTSCELTMDLFVLSRGPVKGLPLFV